MSTAAITLPAASSHTFGRTLRIFFNETRFEFLRLLRTRAFSFSVIGFPVVFYIFFGLIMNRGASIQGVLVAKYMLAGYTVFGMVGAALFGIGVGMAAELSAGWLEVKRASPMPPLAYLLAKCITAMAFGVVIVSLLTLLGVFGYAFAGSTLSHWMGLLGFTLLMLGIAWVAFRRLEQNS